MIRVKRMYKMIAQPLQIGNLEYAHADNRRTIFECNFPTSSVQQFRITEATPLGNHFHKEKHETFVLLRGNGKCAYLPVNKDGAPCGEQTTLDVKKGSVIHIQPFTAH